jgi:hypothetical protein
MGSSSSKIKDDEESMREHERYNTQILKVQELDENDQEFKTVKEHFLKNSRTLTRKVLKIDKNINPTLEEAYEREKKKFKCNSENMLFHGTRCGTNHGNILQVGFKMSFARNGLLGTGIYFADDVDYSDAGYCFNHVTTEKIVKTIIVARVALVPGLHKKNSNIQAIYNELLCFPAYVVYYE